MEFKNISDYSSDNYPNITHILFIEYDNKITDFLVSFDTIGYFYSDRNGLHFLLAKTDDTAFKTYEDIYTVYESINYSSKTFPILKNISIKQFVYRFFHKTSHNMVYRIKISKRSDQIAILIINEFLFNAKIPINVKPTLFITKKMVQLNQFLSIELKQGETLIYVNDELFKQCMFLLLSIPTEQMQDYDEIDSIDKASEILDNSLEGEENNYRITPEEEFFGHCSNLQAWIESDYDSRLLHRNLAFPLLKKLSEAGDKLAKIKFKEEIVQRFNSGHPTVMLFLEKEGYLDKLTEEEKAFLDIRRCVRCKSTKIFEREFEIITSLLNSLWVDERKVFFHYLNLNQKKKKSFHNICKSCFIKAFLVFNQMFYDHLNFKYDDFDRRIEKRILIINLAAFHEFGIYYLGHNLIKHYLYNDSLESLFNQSLIDPKIFMNLISNSKGKDQELYLIHFKQSVKLQDIDYVLYISERIFLISLYLLNLCSEIILSRQTQSMQNDSLTEEFEILTEDLEVVRRSVPSISFLEKIINNKIQDEFNFLFSFSDKLNEYIYSHSPSTGVSFNIPIEDLDQDELPFSKLKHFCFIVKRLKNLFLELGNKIW